MKSDRSMKRRYTPNQEPTGGSWSVLDNRPERPTETPSRVMVGLSKDDASDAADLLNKLDDQKTGRSKQNRRSK